MLNMKMILFFVKKKVYQKVEIKKNKFQILYEEILEEKIVQQKLKVFFISRRSKFHQSKPQLFTKN